MANKQQYVREYLEYCDKDYLFHRIRNVLVENLSFGTGEFIDREELIEEISPKIIKTGKQRLYTSLKKQILK